MNRKNRQTLAALNGLKSGRPQGPSRHAAMREYSADYFNCAAKCFRDLRDTEVLAYNAERGTLAAYVAEKKDAVRSYLDASRFYRLEAAASA